MCRYVQKDLDNVKAIIMKEKKPTLADFIKYDVNRDGKITSLDYVMIKKKIGG